MRALVTGASRGIGAATARRLAQPGAEILLHYRTHRAEAEAVAEEVRAHGARATLLTADLGDRAAVGRLADEVAAAVPALDVLVMNAGTYPRTPFPEATPEVVADCFAQNLLGPIELIRRLLPRLADGARIVLVSSVLAFEGSRRGAPYAAAKAAIVGLGMSLARELAPGVRVNVVAPGPIDTAILAEDTPERRARRVAQVPLGRIGTPEEVAEAIAFLASERSSFLTGTVVHVNGGLRMG
ncbi:MAG: SDR family NAD(P)-dependent oxidoreductase [Thermoplasmata archaeon]